MAFPRKSKKSPSIGPTQEAHAPSTSRTPRSRSVFFSKIKSSFSRTKMVGDEGDLSPIPDLPQSSFTLPSLPHTSSTRPDLRTDAILSTDDHSSSPFLEDVATKEETVQSSEASSSKQYPVISPENDFDPQLVWVAQTSPYWTGRFTSLRDRLQNQTHREQVSEILNLPPEKYELVFEESATGVTTDREVLHREMRVFTALEVQCVTAEAKASLLGWQRAFAIKFNKPELMPSARSAAASMALPPALEHTQQSSAPMRPLSQHPPAAAAGPGLRKMSTLAEPVTYDDGNSTPVAYDASDRTRSSRLPVRTQRFASGPVSSTRLGKDDRYVSPQRKTSIPLRPPPARDEVTRRGTTLGTSTRDTRRLRPLVQPQQSPREPPFDYLRSRSGEKNNVSRPSLPRHSTVANLADVFEMSSLGLARGSSNIVEGKRPVRVSLPRSRMPTIKKEASTLPPQPVSIMREVSPHVPSAAYLRHVNREPDVQYSQGVTNEQLAARNALLSTQPELFRSRNRRPKLLNPGSYPRDAPSLEQHGLSRGHDIDEESKPLIRPCEDRFWLKQRDLSGAQHVIARLEKQHDLSEAQDVSPRVEELRDLSGAQHFSPRVEEQRDLSDAQHASPRVEELRDLSGTQPVSPPVPEHRDFSGIKNGSSHLKEQREFSETQLVSPREKVHRDSSGTQHFSPHSNNHPDNFNARPEASNNAPIRERRDLVGSTRPDDNTEEARLRDPRDASLITRGRGQQERRPTVVPRDYSGSYPQARPKGPRDGPSRDLHLPKQRGSTKYQESKRIWHSGLEDASDRDDLPAPYGLSKSQKASQHSTSQDARSGFRELTSDLNQNSFMVMEPKEYESTPTLFSPRSDDRSRPSSRVSVKSRSSKEMIMSPRSPKSRPSPPRVSVMPGLSQDFTKGPPRSNQCFTTQEMMQIMSPRMSSNHSRPSRRDTRPSPRVSVKSVEAEYFEDGGYTAEEEDRHQWSRNGRAADYAVRHQASFELPALPRNFDYEETGGTVGIGYDGDRAASGRADKSFGSGRADYGIAERTPTRSSRKGRADERFFFKTTDRKHRAVDQSFAIGTTPTRSGRNNRAYTTGQADETRKDSPPSKSSFLDKRLPPRRHEGNGNDTDASFSSSQTLVNDQAGKDTKNAGKGGTTLTRNENPLMKGSHGDTAEMAVQKYLNPSPVFSEATIIAALGNPRWNKDGYPYYRCDDGKDLWVPSRDALPSDILAPRGGRFTRGRSLGRGSFGSGSKMPRRIILETIQGSYGRLLEMRGEWEREKEEEEVEEVEDQARLMMERGRRKLGL